MEDAANDGLRWRLQQVNVVLRNEAEKITPLPPLPSRHPAIPPRGNKEGKIESGGWM